MSKAQIKRRGMVYFHLTLNNRYYDYNSQVSITSPIEAIQFITESEAMYSKYGDPDELGSYLVSFLKSSMTKNIEEFETFLFLNKIKRDRYRVYGTKHNMTIHNLFYTYHVSIDVETNKVLDVSIDSTIGSSKLGKVFPEFFKEVQEIIDM